MKSKNNKTLVSVVIPIFNGEKYITETIESVIAQTYNNWELIIIDNCSTDMSRNIIADYVKKDNRITLIPLETNSGGPARPRNIGIEASKGEYIAFLDADDVWEQNKLEKQVFYMIEHLILATCTNITKIDASGTLIKQGFTDFLHKRRQKLSLKKILRSNSICTSSVMVSSKCFDTLRFDEDGLLMSTEDYYLWLSLMHRYKIIFLKLSDDLVKYRVMNDSIYHKVGWNYYFKRRNYCVYRFILNEDVEVNYVVLWMISLLRLSYRKITLLFSLFNFNRKI